MRSLIGNEDKFQEPQRFSRPDIVKRTEQNEDVESLFSKGYRFRKYVNNVKVKTNMYKKRNYL